GYEYVTRDQARLLAGLGSPGPMFQFTSVGITSHRDRRLDMLNVRYIVASSFNGGRDALAAQPDRFRLVAEADHTHVFENLRTLPRAWVVPRSGARPVVSVEAAVDGMQVPSFDPTREVFVPTSLPPRRGA